VRGQALVEFALVLVVLCSLFVAAFDYGRVMNLYLVTVQATHEAARVASLAGSTPASITAAAQNAAADSIAAQALDVTCQSATFDAATAAYSVSGPCAASMPADSAFVLTVSTTVAPVVPISGLLFGVFRPGPIPVSYSVTGIVQAGS
jgi:Flp pilus assembly protein TadG